MANIAKTYSLVNGQPADATQVNKNFDDIIAGVGDVATLRPTVASLGLDADITTLVLPANTTISAAGAELINDTNAAAQIATLGAVATGDSRLSDARPASDVSAWAKAGTKPAYTYTEVGAPSTSDSRLSDARTPTAHNQLKATISDFPASMPASDVYAWAKAATAPCLFACGSYTGDAAHNRAITVGFQPKLVNVWGMAYAGAGSAKIVAAGGFPLIVEAIFLGLDVALPGLVLSATGFVTANDDTQRGSGNANTVPYYWEAWG